MSSVKKIIDLLSKSMDGYGKVVATNYKGLILNKKVLILSPHPDDEAIATTLALRLKNENSCQVKNLCLTLGSDPLRQRARELELIDSCYLLGFENEINRETNFETIIARTIEDYQPDAIFTYHPHDNHPTHQRVTQALKNALSNFKSQPFHLYFMEYWSPMNKPNMLVEASNATILQLCQAIACHQGEVKKNPYHMSLPSWLIDNSRRAAQTFSKLLENQALPIFSTFYQRVQWQSGKFIDCNPTKIIYRAGEELNIFNY